MSLLSRNRELQIERKRRAAAFLSKIKPGEVTTLNGLSTSDLNVAEATKTAEEDDLLKRICEFDSEIVSSSSKKSLSEEKDEEKLNMSGMTNMMINIGKNLREKSGKNVVMIVPILKDIITSVVNIHIDRRRKNIQKRNIDQERDQDHLMNIQDDLDPRHIVHQKVESNIVIGIKKGSHRQKKRGEKLKKEMKTNLVAKFPVQILVIIVAIK